MLEKVFINKEKAIEAINDFGAGRQKFFFLTSFDGEQNLVQPINRSDALGIRYEFGNKLQPNHHNSAIELQAHLAGYEQFTRKFDAVIKEIREGNSYLTNLTFKTPVTTTSTLEDIYEKSVAKYKVKAGDHFVAFSPETFIRIKDGLIKSYPMKGTIDAAITNAKQVILNDPKERAEHVTIVDLIRNDLSMVAKNVRVTSFRHIDKLFTNNKNLLQVSSEITGLLEGDWNQRLGDIIFQLLPAGSISGAPKKKTVSIIRSVEDQPRGFYTGIFGVYDGYHLDSCVLIRYIERENGQLYYRSGGGITSRSNARSEYEEMIHKIYVPVY